MLPFMTSSIRLHVVGGEHTLHEGEEMVRMKRTKVEIRPKSWVRPNVVEEHSLTCPPETLNILGSEPALQSPISLSPTEDRWKLGIDPSISGTRPARFIIPVGHLVSICGG